MKRRDFLKNVSITGAAIGLSTGGVLLHTRETAARTAEHPYGYPASGLDVEATRQLGYDGYKGITLSDGITHKDCAFATFHAIIGQLQDIVGAPYTGIPTQMMEWASGGIAGYASFCGALNGACAAIGLICSNSDAKLFISDLLAWYAETELPTNIIAPTGPLTQSIAETSLCHNSVTNWCIASGYASGSSERSERCARLSGDVAAKVVDLLDNGALGLVVPGDKTVCRSCHYKGTDYAAGQFTRGKMNCLECHNKVKKIPLNGHHGKP